MRPSDYFELHKEIERGTAPTKLSIFKLNSKFPNICKIYHRIHFCDWFLMKTLTNEYIDVLVTHGKICFHVFQQNNNNRKKNVCNDVTTIFLLPCLVSFPCGKLLVNQ